MGDFLEYVEKDLNQKISFLHWFLSNHKLKDKQFLYIFEFLIENPKHLEKTHFIQDASLFENSMVLTVEGVYGSPCIYRYKRATAFDFFTIKNYILFNFERNEQLFIQINYENVFSCLEYEKVNAEKMDVCNLLLADQKMLDEFFNYQNLLLKKHFLEYKIDESLKNRDLLSFQKYCFEFSEEILKELPHNNEW